MKLLHALLISTLFSFSVSSQEWISPTDTKYQKSHPELFQAFTEARSELDTWRGEQSKLRNAHSILNKILEENDKFAPAYREYGRLLIRAGMINSQSYSSGRLSSAESSIKYALELDPDYADAYVLLSYLYIVQGNVSQARDALNKAEKIGTNSPWFNINRARLYDKIGNEKLAAKHYELVLQSDTTNKRAIHGAASGLATIYANSGMKEKTIEMHEKIIALEPESAWAWGNYATEILYRFGLIDEAIAKGEKALSLMNYGLARRNLAVAYCTKWANSPDPTSEASQQFLKRATDLASVSHISKEAASYGHTRACHEAINKYGI